MTHRRPSTGRSFTLTRDELSDAARNCPSRESAYEHLSFAVGTLLAVGPPCRALVREVVDLFAGTGAVSRTRLPTPLNIQLSAGGPVIVCLRGALTADRTAVQQLRQPFPLCRSSMFAE